MNIEAILDPRSSNKRWTSKTLHFTKAKIRIRLRFTSGNCGDQGSSAVIL